MAPRRIILAGGLIALAGLLAYLNGCSGPLVLDDRASILENPTIRHLWPAGGAFSPPAREGITVSGRPILNFSLALNWALGGKDLRGYHAANVLIHILAALTLFGIVRRTLERARPGAAARQGDGGRALLIAWAAALLWAVHPLQTESVTYIIQRAESLMGLFYLLTLYCFIRQAGASETLAGSALGWAALSVVCCLLGMGTKEVMASAPVIVFLYDRVFAAGSFREAWRRRRGYYLALAATWIPLVWLVLGTGNRGGTSGVGIGVGALAYWPTQFPAILKYLKLVVWPSPLVFDYGTEWIRDPGAVVPAAVAVLALAAGVVWLWRRKPALGFAGVFFFAILAPTSLVPGVRQTMAEHRMYLALAPLAVLAALGLSRLRGLAKVERSDPGALHPLRFILVVSALAAGLGCVTAERNQDYRTVLALYGDTVAKQPDNAFARNNLGMALVAAGRVPAAIAQYREALRLNPNAAETHNNLGVALDDEGQEQEAVNHYAEAIRIRPDYAEAYSNLGQALFHAGHRQEAEECFRRALKLKPALAEAHLNLGNALAARHRFPSAAAEYEEALRLDPEYAEAENNLGNLLFEAGRLSEALPHVQAALRLRPSYAEPHLNLANILASTGQLQAAVAEYRRTLQLSPGNANAHYDLAQVLRALGRRDEAADELDRARKLQGPNPGPPGD